MMRRISLALLGATAIGVVLSQGALAADILRKAPAPAPLPPPVQDWSGIYVGLEAGYGWGQQNGNLDPFFNNKELNSAHTCKDADGGSCGLGAIIGSVSQSGWLAGGHAG